MAVQQRWDVLDARFHRTNPRVRVREMAQWIESVLSDNESRPVTRRRSLT
jgi:hypothetical protein